MAWPLRRRPTWAAVLVGVTVTLPLSYVEHLRRYGGDNISDGVRRLVEEARTPLGQF